MQSKAAKKVAPPAWRAVLAGVDAAAGVARALGRRLRDAIYGMSSTGSKGSSIKFEMPSFGGGDDAPDTAAADKKKADDAAAAKEAAAAKAAEREAAREARQAAAGAAGRGQEARGGGPGEKDAAIAKAKAATAAASKKEDAAPAFKPPDSFSAPSFPTFDAPKVRSRRHV